MRNFWYMQSGYPKKLIESKMEKVVFSNKRGFRNKKVNGIPICDYKLFTI